MFSISKFRLISESVCVCESLVEQSSTLFSHLKIYRTPFWVSQKIHPPRNSEIPYAAEGQRWLRGMAL